MSWETILNDQKPRAERNMLKFACPVGDQNLFSRLFLASMSIRHVVNNFLYLVKACINIGHKEIKV